MSATQRAASYLTKHEAGLSQSKIGDVRQIIKLLKEQHKESSRTKPSLLLMLVEEARQEWRAKRKKAVRK